jgi:hypothetical protein
MHVFPPVKHALYPIRMQQLIALVHPWPYLAKQIMICIHNVSRTFTSHNLVAPSSTIQAKKEGRNFSVSTNLISSFFVTKILVSTILLSSLRGNQKPYNSPHCHVWWSLEFLWPTTLWRYPYQALLFDFLIDNLWFQKGTLLLSV